MPIKSTFSGASSRAFGFTSGGVRLDGYYQIATTTVSSPVGNIEFTGIPSTYTHLQIRGIARTDRASFTEDQIFVRLNSDTATNYSYHRFYSDGASVTSAASSTIAEMSTFYAPAASATSSIFGSVVIDILDSANTNKYKTLRMIGGHDRNGGGYVSLFSGNWRNTDAITTIKLFPSSANLVQYSSFALYGVTA
jgi:hypothetical protein